MYIRAAVRISGTEYVERGEPIQLQCNASGKPDPPHDLHWLRNDNPVNPVNPVNSNPPHDLHWLRNDNPVKSDPSAGVLVAKKIEAKYLLSVLSIERSRFSDAGEYVCVTSNHHTASAIVHVLSGR